MHVGNVGVFNEFDTNLEKNKIIFIEPLSLEVKRGGGVWDV